jgi:ABC-type polysaccharide/polyol phosphate export permease
MADIWRYRVWIWESALSDLRNRYAGSSLGVFWNVVNPLIMLGIYVVIFTSLLSSRSVVSGNSSVIFPLYLTCGFLPWITFSDGLMRCTQTFLTNAVYLKKVAIPEVVFVAQTGLSALLSMVIAVCLLLALAIVLGQAPSWTWLLLPGIVVLWQGFGFGLSLVLSTITVFFRDVGQLLGVLLQIWMWSVPIVYFEDVLPSAYRAILAFNPAYPFVVGLRAAILNAEVPLWLAGAMLGWVAVALVAGYVVLSSLRSELRDVL